jgi:hypothetical protein
MSDALEQHRMNCEEMKLAGMIWWLILWHASCEGKLEIPLRQNWLSSELASAIIDDASRMKCFFLWEHDGEGNECVQDFGEESQLNDAMDECEKNHPYAFNGSTIESEMRALLKRFVHYEFQSAQNEKDWISELRLFHENNTPRTMRQIVFTPNREMYERADMYLHTVQPSFEWWAIVSEWYRKIARLMYPYIERDVAYIKSHYSW